VCPSLASLATFAVVVIKSSASASSSQPSTIRIRFKMDDVHNIDGWVKLLRTHSGRAADAASGSPIITEITGPMIVPAPHTGVTYVLHQRRHVVIYRTDPRCQARHFHVLHAYHLFPVRDDVARSRWR